MTTASSRPLKADQRLASIYGEDFTLLRLVRESGRRLRELRIERGLTQNEVAELASTAQAQISDVENGKRLTVTVRGLANQAAALGYRTVITFEPEGTDG